MKMTWTLRTNSDRSLPASHLIEIIFAEPGNLPGGGVATIPGILMKDSESGRGTPLAGLAVKVTTGYFLIGLSAGEDEALTNVAMLKQRRWFDIPIVYANDKRAIIALDKGATGDRVFRDAFLTWKAGTGTGAAPVSR
jgi:hypothetical protein